MSLDSIKIKYIQKFNQDLVILEEILDPVFKDLYEYDLGVLLPHIHLHLESHRKNEMVFNVKYEIKDLGERYLSGATPLKDLIGFYFCRINHYFRDTSATPCNRDLIIFKGITKREDFYVLKFSKTIKTPLCSTKKEEDTSPYIIKAKEILAWKENTLKKTRSDILLKENLVIKEIIEGMKVALSEPTYNVLTSKFESKKVELSENGSSLYDLLEGNLSEHLEAVMPYILKGAHIYIEKDVFQNKYFWHIEAEEQTYALLAQG